MKPIFIICGDKGSGKTTFLKNVSNVLQLNDFVVGGFIALHELSSDCYQIKDIRTNEKTLLMQRVATPDHRPLHFKFFSKGVETGDNCVKKLINQPPDIAIIDEIGGYELAGKLWSDSFTQLMQSSIPVIFTTKDRLLKRVVEMWRIEPTHIFKSEEFDDFQKAFERIKKFL